MTAFLLVSDGGALMTAMRTMWRVLPRAAVAGVALVAAACGGGGDTTAPPVNALTDLTATPASVTIANPGGSATITTSVTTASGASVAYANTSSNVAVASVAATGANPVVTAVGAGTATITIAATGSGTNLVTTTITRTVNITITPVATIQVSLAASLLGGGSNTQATATPKDAGGTTLTGRTMAWSSSNATVATVNAATGLITAVGGGTATITATVEGVSGTAQVSVCQAGLAPPTAGVTTVFVSATNGNDATGTGSCVAPYKTITKGVTGTTTGMVVRAAPGTYNTALGETFPILLPTGVSLVGDEANKGQGTTATKIIGDGAINGTGACGAYFTVVYAAANATIAGFELTDPSGQSGHMTMVVRTDGVVIRNNTLTGMPGGGAAIYICNASVNQIITGNRIVNNSTVGLGFIGGGAGARVENNVITGNTYGVEYDSPGGDLGGGATGSVGGNVISCNVVNDLWTNNGITINAANNFWDHFPLSGNDLFNGSAATILTTGGRVASSPCS